MLLKQLSPGYLAILYTEFAISSVVQSLTNNAYDNACNILVLTYILPSSKIIYLKCTRLFQDILKLYQVETNLYFLAREIVVKLEKRMLKRK